MPRRLRQFARELAILDFSQRGAPAVTVGACFIRRDGFMVHVRVDGFHISFPDGHSSDYEAGSTSDPVGALEHAILSFELAHENEGHR